MRMDILNLINKYVNENNKTIVYNFIFNYCKNNNIKPNKLELKIENMYDSFLNRKIKMLYLDKNNGIEIAVIEDYNKKAKRFKDIFSYETEYYENKILERQEKIKKLLTNKQKTYGIINLSNNK